jgi:hypothetical protein
VPNVGGDTLHMGVVRRHVTTFWAFSLALQPHENKSTPVELIRFQANRIDLKWLGSVFDLEPGFIHRDALSDFYA